uniref:LysE/ArgO family amino acid transporter n=1 Tax=Pararhizobium sp. IMCC3301 TaxID=3067904 RepID=UPI002741E834|nr:LysE/ArgO family amino acid transporter [Pararhizobium sp. IMCC3301]
MDQLAPAVAGFSLGSGLIMAIGAQNAYVLRLGLLRRHVFAVCLLCALSDALLIVLGIAGLGSLLQGSEVLLSAVTYGGAAFLFIYGLLAFKRVFSPGTLKAATQQIPTLRAALATALAFTFLNPHVYLDTVLLLGGFSAKYPMPGRIAFGLGAVTASFIWFFALGYGARLLAPLFAQRGAWQVLDLLIGSVMWTLALSLLFG